MAGMMFEGLYEEPSLGHLVGLVRYYVHQMELISKEEVSGSFFFCFDSMMSYVSRKVFSFVCFFHSIHKTRWFLVPFFILSCKYCTSYSFYV